MSMSALDLERLLASMPKGLAAGQALADALLAKLPPDVLRAASTADGAMRQMRQEWLDLDEGNYVAELTFTAEGDWLQLSIMDAVATFLSGRARTCIHSPEAGQPQPVFAAAWRPGLITCAECVRLLEIKDAVADSMCDRCGQSSHPEGEIWPMIAHYVWLTFAYGLCRSCKGESP
jgi:hypothetical protein